MKTKALLVSLLFILNPYAYADENSPSQAAPSSPANSIAISSRPEILGLWGMKIPNNKKCVEYYNFRADNEVIVHSAKEWSMGIYEYQPSVENSAEELPALIMQVKYDNNEEDCSGQKVDQTGDISQFFVKWKNNSTIDFCSNEKGEQCFATLNRVLP